MSMTTKLGKVVTLYDVLPSIKSHEPLSHCFPRSRDKLKSLYINYNNGYGF